jgi:uncharacterized protein (TIGR03437 family)
MRAGRLALLGYRGGRVLSIFLAFGAAAQQPLQITSFSVGPDQALAYPNNSSDPPYLVDLPDEHTTFLPPASAGAPYLVFAASKLSGGTGGAVALETTDLQNFTFATSLGYNRQVMTPPVAIDQCNPAYTTEFDGNYAAPGSVVQDPTLPPGNLIMLYEAENHCPGGVNQQPFYATVGFTRSSDNGKTWPAPINGVSGGPARHPVLQSSVPQPAVSHPAMGDAIPSAFVDKGVSGDYYLYVTYLYRPGPGGTSDGLIRVARAKLGQDPLVFSKWYNGSFNQPGIGGLDSGAPPGPGCANGGQAHSEINYNDDVGLYLMIFVCVNGPAGTRAGAWYFSTATSLDLQDWTEPQMILNSQFPLTSPCPGQTDGGQFDGWYPSFMSPGAASGHTKLTGRVFFQNGCDTGARQFMSRTFTITAASAAPPVVTPGTVANGATYAAGNLVPGSWAQLKGANLATSSRTWAASDFTGLGSNLPTNVGGTSVTVNGKPATVYYISSNQLDFQVPSGITGTASVQVSNTAGTSGSVTAATAANAPGIWPIIVNGTNYAAAVFLDGLFAGDPSIASVFRNAKTGDKVQLFGTALAPSPAGVQVSFQPLNGVTVTIGSITVPADAAGLVAVGEFQVNFTLPPQFASMPEGNYPITVTVNGVSSPATINSNPPGPLVIPIQH